MDVWEKRREHVEGQERDDLDDERQRERLGGNSTGATGTVNVGTGSANINIGSTAASAIVIGNAAGSITLKSALTLGAAPTTAGQLGFVSTLVNNVTLTCPISGTANTSAVFLPTEAGTYVVNGNFTWASGTPDLISISTTNGTINVFCTGTLPNGKYLNLNTIISVGTSASIYIVSNATTGTYVGHLKCARIG